MELKDTVELMNSDDYKERFKAEYYQLKIRYERLEKFLESIVRAQDWGIEEPKHNTSFEMMEHQYRVMLEYLNTLEDRAKIEGIDL